MPENVGHPEIEDALRARNFAALKEAFKSTELHHAAAIIESMEEEDRAVAFRLLGHDQAAELFEYLDPEIQEGLIRGLGRDRVASILNEMSPDDRTALLEELPSAVTRNLINMLSPEERRIAVTLLGYPEDSIGRLMTPDYVRVKEHWTVQRVLEHIRRRGEDSETLNVIYVIDDQGRLVDDLRIRFLLLADPGARLADIMDRVFVALQATDDQEVAVSMFQEYDRVALPVVDSRGVLLGIVTFDDVMDVAEEEATEDMHMLGGVEALDEPYIQTGFAEMVRKRAVWLVLLFLGQMLTANVVEHYQVQLGLGPMVVELAAAAVLVAFMPAIIATGGNSGSQAATLVIRSLALGEVGLRDWFRVMRREIASGASLGAMIGVIGFLRIVVDHFLFGKYGAQWPWIALAIAMSLVAVVMWGTVVGSMLPFMLERLGFDPAASSTPFVATIVDVTGLILYFSLSIHLLQSAYP